jgi:hypothetical protein
MVWNEFSMAEGSQVATISCQDNVDLFFFNAARIIHHEFVLEGMSVYSHYYLGVMEHLYARMCCGRNEQLRNNPWWLLHDNMPTRCTVNVN